jgi:predicted acylesterase/phospholipase RssA
MGDYGASQKTVLVDEPRTKATTPAQQTGSAPGAQPKGSKPRRSQSGTQGTSSKATGHLKSTDVKYLAFEGGGGKGITYLGAIEALEELKILPVNKPAGKNQILGLAGSSAGAITALLLALGLSSTEFKELLGQPQKFNAFFDGPSPSFYRVNDIAEGKRQRGRDPKVDDFVVAKRQLWLTLLGTAISSVLPKDDNPILKAIRRDVGGYLYNIIFDRGLFPGFAVLEFFQGLLREFTAKQGKDADAVTRAGIKRDGSDMTFEQFHKLTKIDLAFTGVNVTTKRLGRWSRSTTPKFPIADAVSISMNIPLLFKPVRVDQSPSTQAVSATGFWVDGGVLNNLPLHLFDDNADNPNRSSKPGLPGLHPNVLALRLTPGGTTPSKLSEEPVDPLDERFAVLRNYLGELGDAFMSPSEEGQIRTPEEQNQIIELYTGDLSLTEFAPPQAKWEWPVKNAKEVVTGYFAEPSK